MDIKEARKEIDRIDRQMTALFRERLLLCDAIAKYKDMKFYLWSAPHIIFSLRVEKYR